MNDVHYFQIEAEEPRKAVQIYVAVFGWKFVRDVNIPVEYWRIDTEGIRGAILQRPAAVSALHSGTNGFVCSM